MTVLIRKAGPLDTRPMAELLNQIIEIGGTTAYTEPVTSEDLAQKMARYPQGAAWHIAEDEQGNLLGFQWIAPNPWLPPEAVDIATFVRVGQTGLGVGSALFDRSKASAQGFGYSWINASIRADNTGGLAYYQSRGFEDWSSTPGQGQGFAKVHKRFDLD